MEAERVEDFNCGIRAKRLTMMMTKVMRLKREMEMVTLT